MAVTMHLLYLAVFISILIEVRSQDCREGIVRLVEGSSPLEGRVEIFLNGYWGTVCDDYWSLDDAVVVCRQLGFSTEEALSFGAARFGEGSGPIILDNVVCEGNEEYLVNCPRSVQEDINCNHGDDAGVRCRAGTLPNITVEATARDTSVLVRWSGSPVPDKYNITVTNTLRTSSTTRTFQIISEVPSNQSVIEYEDLDLESNYTVCAIGIYCSRQTVTSCINIASPALAITHTPTLTPIPKATTAMVTSIRPTINSATASNTSLLGGILGFVIAVLVLVLIVAGVGLAYPRCIRHRVKDKKYLSDISEFLDKAMYPTSKKCYIDHSQRYSTREGVSRRGGTEINAFPVYETIRSPPSDSKAPELTVDIMAQHPEASETRPLVRQSADDLSVNEKESHQLVSAAVDVQHITSRIPPSPDGEAEQSYKADSTPSPDETDTNLSKNEDYNLSQSHNESVQLISNEAYVIKGISKREESIQLECNEAYYTTLPRERDDSIHLTSNGAYTTVKERVDRS